MFKKIMEAIEHCDEIINKSDECECKDWHDQLKNWLIDYIRFKKLFHFNEGETVYTIPINKDTGKYYIDTVQIVKNQPQIYVKFKNGQITDVPDEEWLYLTEAEAQEALKNKEK